MPKTLITGGAGFLGLHLGRALHARGHAVTLLDNFARARRDAELDAFINCQGVDLANRDLLLAGSLDDLGGDYDYIIHLAALLGVQNVRNRPFEVLTWNTAMLEQVIGLARRQNRLSRLLFASTSEVYAGTLHYFGMAFPTPETTPLTVNDLGEPRTTYMLSKIYGEALCRHSGLPATIFRVHNAYGPRMGLSHVIPELLSKAYRLAEGSRLEVFSADHRRTFCYVSDVVEFIARMAEAPGCAGQSLNIGNETPEITMADLARIVLRTVGRPADILPLPATPGSPPRRAPDISKAVAITGYRPRVEIADGVARTFEWYRTHVFDGGAVSAI